MSLCRDRSDLGRSDVSLCRDGSDLGPSDMSLGRDGSDLGPSDMSLGSQFRALVRDQNHNHIYSPSTLTHTHNVTW